MSSPPGIGVCSWSLRPGSPAQLAERMARLGWRGETGGRVQLALDPIRRAEWDADETARVLREAGIAIASGMMAMEGEDYSTPASIRATGGIVPDRHWGANLAAARESAELASRLGIGLVTFHAGFMPHERTDARRGVLLERLRLLAEFFGDLGIRVGLETGQETAATLLDVLDELDGPGVAEGVEGVEGVGVNFDPANMILYGMGDPVAALRVLAPRVVQVHIKDALPARRPGEWGTETRVGEGAVDWPALVATLREMAPARALMIEREGGVDPQRRVEDIIAARRVVERLMGCAS